MQIKIAAVEAFLQTGSVIASQRALRRNNQDRHEPVPERHSIMRWVRQWRNFGNVQNINSPGRRTSKRTPANAVRVRTAFQQSPRRSARRHALTLRLSRRSLGRLLTDIKFHPYKIQMAHELKEIDMVNRRIACENILARMAQEPMFLNKLLMSDEANFFLSGCVNKQNFRYWSDENPLILHQKPPRSQKVVVWCAVGMFGIIGPYFFEDRAGRTLTVNADRYVDMVGDFVMPELHVRQQESIWFQQDGATPHTARQSLAVLRDLFPNQLISRFGDLTLPSRSPDLTAPDYFLWGYLKEKVYTHRLQTLQELKNTIRREIHAIPRDMIRRVMEAFPRRLQQCIDANGGHLTDVIFKH